MLAQLLDTLNLSPARERERRHALADRIAALLEERGSIVLDRTALAELDAGWQAAMRASCELALREQAQLRTDPVGRIEVVANGEFARRMEDEAARARRRAFTGRDTAVMTCDSLIDEDDAFDLDDPEPVAATLFLVADADARHPPSSRVMKALADIPEASPESQDDNDTAADADVIHFPVHVARHESEFGWFDIDVAPPEDPFGNCGEKLPLDRQSLPERKREPWIILDNAVLESSDQ